MSQTFSWDSSIEAIFSKNCSLDCFAFYMKHLRPESVRTNIPHQMKWTSAIKTYIYIYNVNPFLAIGNQDLIQKKLPQAPKE